MVVLFKEKMNNFHGGNHSPGPFKSIPAISPVPRLPNRFLESSTTFSKKNRSRRKKIMKGDKGKCDVETHSKYN
jgi:hypothetical protein